MQTMAHRRIFAAITLAVVYFSTAPPVQLTLTLIHLGKKVKGSLKSRDRLFDKSKSRPSTAIVNGKEERIDFFLD
ncbi:hypothetical protein [Leptospira adleri]|nr:hypothetical protein [Leptospira adleri]